MLQDQRRAAGALRRVGHAPKLRREQRADGLREASPTSLTTAFTADPQTFDGHAPPTTPRQPKRTGQTVKVRKVATTRTKFQYQSSWESGKLAVGRYGVRGGVHGAQVAKPACGGGLSAARQVRGAEGVGAGLPAAPGRLRRARSASDRSASRTSLPLRGRRCMTRVTTLLAIKRRH